MRSIREVDDLKGVRVLVRVDFNEPMRDGKVLGTFRVDKTLPLITFLQSVGAHVLLISHQSGDPSEKSLRPIVEYLNEHVPTVFGGDVFSDQVLNNKDVVLFENIRQHPGEESNDQTFAKHLASLGDIYVNEAFPVSHRQHASVVTLPLLLPSYVGFQFEQEVKHLSQVLNPPRPSFFILGGAKPETKVPLVRQFLNVADVVFAGGLSANEFFVAQGHDLGSSLVSGKDFDIVESVGHPKLLLPKDVHVLSEDGTVMTCNPRQERVTGRIVDVGSQTLDLIAEVIQKSVFIVWNGPLGDTDLGYFEGTRHLARLIAESDAETIVGGGDTIAAIEPLHLEEKFTFVSTAGAAMIDFLIDGTLPGIVALEQSELR